MEQIYKTIPGAENSCVQTSPQHLSLKHLIYLKVSELDEWFLVACFFYILAAKTRCWAACGRSGCPVSFWVSIEGDVGKGCVQNTSQTWVHIFSFFFLSVFLNCSLSAFQSFQPSRSVSISVFCLLVWDVSKSLGAKGESFLWFDVIYGTQDLHIVTLNSVANLTCDGFLPCLLWRGHLYTCGYQYTYFLKAFLYVSKLLFNVCVSWRTGGVSACIQT